MVVPTKDCRTMLKAISAILSAAAVAAVITVVSSPSGTVDAGPLAQPAEAALKSCKQRPWPYLNCVGTPLGNQRIRLVTTDRLTP
jgi:hypothetical protein